MTTSRDGSKTGDLLEGIRVVVFDAVGTLMTPDPAVSAVYAEVIQRHARIPIDVSVIHTAIAAALAARNNTPDLRTSELSEREFWLRLIEELCPVKAVTHLCFQELFEHFAQPHRWVCYPDAVGIVQELSRRDLVVALGSNFDSRLHTVCDGLPELAMIRHRVISSEVGWRKPAAEFFDAVARVTGAEPAEILMVGDDPENDIRGAIAAGFRAAWIDRSGMFRQLHGDRCHRITSLGEIFASGFGVGRVHPDQSSETARDSVREVSPR